MSTISKIAGWFAGATAGVVIAMGTAYAPLTPIATAAPIDGQDVGTVNDPPCGFDVYKGKVDVMSLGKAHGTVRVTEWDKRVKLNGEPRKGSIGTLVGTKRIKAGHDVTIKPSKRIKASHVTVDIVKGQLTKDEGNGRRKIWQCDPA